MKYALQVIEGYKFQPIPLIVLTCGTQKYFFNVPETTQRFIRENGVKVNAGSNIFLTRISTSHISGIYGLLLTLFEQKIGYGVKIYGPGGLANYMNNIRFLMGYRLLLYSVFDLKSENQKLLGIKTSAAFDKALQDPKFGQIFYNMNNYLAAVQQENPDSVNDASSLIDKDGTFKDENVSIIPVPINSEASLTLNRPVMAYICKSIKFPGKFHPEKLDAFKIPKKRMHEFVNKGSIEVDGKVYTLDQVREPDYPSNVVIIVDCPSREYIKGLTQNNAFDHLFESQINEQQELIKAIVHVGSSDVLMDPRYCEWMFKFPKTTEHIIVSPNFIENDSEKEEEKNSDNIDVDEYKHTTITNIAQSFFPQYLPKIEKSPSEKNINIEKAFAFLKTKSLPTKNYEFGMHPANTKGWKPLNIRDFAVETKKKLIDASKQEKWQSYRKKFNQRKEALNPEDIKLVKKLFATSDPELVFLGTGSMMPSQYRNVSAILLRFWQNQDAGILLDCGEGTYSQILNHYGYKQARNIIVNLKVIFITHIHADHHLGMLQLLHERSRILKEENLPEDPVYIVIPFNMTPWITRYTKLIEPLSYKLVYSQHIDVNSDKVHLTKEKMVKVDDHIHVGSKGNGMLLQGNITHAADGEDMELEYYDDPETAELVREYENEAITNLKPFQALLKEKFQITNFKAVAVYHCPQAYGILIESESGWKLVYSGDTRFCDNLIKECQGATILIHESTFMADLVKNANEKNHSTSQDAIKTGMKMGAWRTILTHFSQRYSKGAPQKQKETNDKGLKVQKNEEELYESHNSILAIDHLGCKLSDLMVCPYATKYLNKLLIELQFETAKSIGSV